MYKIARKSLRFLANNLLDLLQSCLVVHLLPQLLHFSCKKQNQVSILYVLPLLSGDHWILNLKFSKSVNAFETILYKTLSCFF